MKFERLRALFEENRYPEFISEINLMNSFDIAFFLRESLPSERYKIFRMLKKDISADVFAELEHDLQEEIIESMKDYELSAFMDSLAMDDTVDMLEEFPANVVNRILKSTSPERRKEINRFLQYPEGSAASVMTSEFLCLKSYFSVADAVAYIRKTGINKETVYVIYVTDASKSLLGIIELKDLLFASETDVIGDIMNSSIVSASTTDDRETVAELISKYDLLALPIVDSEGRLVGIVTVDDALDVINEEATEDIEKMGAILPSGKPYLRMGVFEAWRKRIPWLLFLMISAAITGKIISYYEGTLARVVALTAFIPMLMDSGGNAGGQASVTVIRSLSLGEIRFGNIFRILWKELRISMLCGLTLATVSFAKVFFIDELGFAVSLVVSLTLLATVVLANAVGASLPLLAKKIRLDPAVVASPFITTVVDATSLAIYFFFATRILGI